MAANGTLFSWRGGRAMGQHLGWASLTRVGCAQILGSDDDADAGWVSCRHAWDKERAPGDPPVKRPDCYAATGNSLERAFAQIEPRCVRLRWSASYNKSGCGGTQPPRIDSRMPNLEKAPTPVWGPGGREFKSRRSDQSNQTVTSLARSAEMALRTACGPAASNHQRRRPCEALHPGQATMTTMEQKEAERRTLEHVLAAVGIVPDESPAGGEAPDFTLTIASRTLGIEVTAFQAGTMTDDGVPLRQVEAEWQRFEAASHEFRQARAYLDDMNIGLFFKASMPPRSEHSAFMEEIASFVIERGAEARSMGTDFRAHHFTSPLITKYLRCFHLRRGKYPEWFSNLTGGWVDAPDGALTAIVRKKSGKQYRPTDELWLAIQCNPRTSELMMPIEGAVDFTYVAGLDAALRTSCFSRVLVVTYGGGTFQWNELDGWTELPGRTRA